MNSGYKRLVFFIAIFLFLSYSLQNVGAQNDTDNLNINNNFRNMLVRLNNNIRPGVAPTRGVREGRVEVSFNRGITWGSVCTAHWSNREANVVCRQLRLGYAARTTQSTRFGNSRRHKWAMVGTLCRGNEARLADCLRESAYPGFCNPRTNRNVAEVRCAAQLADLSLGLREIETSAHLDSKPMSELKCAMEENCVSRDAYTLRLTQPNAVRHLLRFTAKVENIGSADFTPIGSNDTWQWHQCHQHYHSIETFATFDIYNQRYEKVAQGHKASFCLEDSACVTGITPRYTCDRTAQGISIGCSDYYLSSLDCQWVDVTNVPPNKHYILRVAINSQYQVGEISYENNGAECLLYYTGQENTTRITQCKSASLWFKMQV